MHSAADKKTEPARDIERNGGGGGTSVAMATTLFEIARCGRRRRAVAG